MIKKVKFRCACGLYMETPKREDAIALVQLHIKQHHQNELEFGISKTEAESLLTEE